MRVTFFDILFMLSLVGGAAWGFYRGMFRQAATTVVIYVSTIVSTVSYRGLSRMLGSSTGQSATATDMLSFIILMVVTNVPDTQRDRRRGLDRFLLFLFASGQQHGTGQGGRYYEMKRFHDAILSPSG